MKIIGHRGCIYKVENTIESFEEAFNLGADGIEVDVQKTNDGYIVVSHDSNLRRITGEDFDIRKNRVEEVMKKRVQGEKIPLLEEVLELVKNKGKFIDIEIKNRDDLEDTIRIAKKINYGDLIVSSFFHDIIFIGKKSFPEIKFAYLYSHFPRDLEIYIKEVDFLKPNIDFVNYEYKKFSSVTIPWVVNEKEKAEFLKDLNVFAIITDFVDKVIGFIKGEEHYSKNLFELLKSSILKEESEFKENIIKIVLRNKFSPVYINFFELKNGEIEVKPMPPFQWNVGEKMIVSISNFKKDSVLKINIREIGDINIDIINLLKV
ncbi:MAG: glycerophosphodiester phosphodiesterase [Caldisericia bacterium]